MVFRSDDEAQHEPIHVTFRKKPWRSSRGLLCVVDYATYLIINASGMHVSRKTHRRSDMVNKKHKSNQCGRTTIVSLSRRSLGIEEARNTQDYDNEHTSIHEHTHLPKVTIDHRRDINIFSVCWKEGRTSDKIRTKTSPNNY